MINKKRFEEIIKSTGIPYNESISSDKNTNVFPRIVYWEYVWEEVSASNDSYQTVITYQVSMHYRYPRPKELFKLRKAFHEHGLRPTIYHEFIEESKEFHSYFAVDVIEELDE